MGETNTDADPEESSGLSTPVKMGAAIAVTGIITSGVLNYALTRLGAPTAGTVVWVVGYGLTIFALWYVLFRPLDFGIR